MLNLTPDELAELANLVREGRDLRVQRDRIDETLALIGERVRKYLAPGESLEVDGKPLKVQPNRRFDAVAGYDLLDEATRQRCLKVDFDPKLVKQHLTPAQIEACMVEQGEPKIAGLS